MNLMQIGIPVKKLKEKLHHLIWEEIGEIKVLITGKKKLRFIEDTRCQKVHLKRLETIMPSEGKSFLNL